MNTSIALPSSSLNGIIPLYVARSRAWQVEAMLIVAGAALMALAAQARIITPFSTVPFTFQTMMALGLGVALGARTAFLSMAAYLVTGVLGAPVFTGWAAGPAVFAGHTSGYLLGMLMAATLVGALSTEANVKSPVRLAGVLALGQVVTFVTGASMLMVLGLSFQQAIVSGVLVFLPWEMVKLTLLAGILPLMCKAAETLRRDA
jgi:biotin transport system substrate-specific component